MSEDRNKAASRNFATLYGSTKEMNRFERIKEDFEKSKKAGITIRKEDIEWLILTHIEQREEIKFMEEFIEDMAENYGVPTVCMKDYIERHYGTYEK